MSRIFVAKAVGSFVLAAGIASLDPRAHVFGYFCVVMAVIFILALLTSPRLVLTPDGLTYRSRLGKKSWRWSDFDQFFVYEFVLGLNILGCRFSEAHIRTIQPIPDPLVDRSRGLIGLFWEVPLPKLVALLNEARRHWSTPLAAGNQLVSPS